MLRIPLALLAAAMAALVVAASHTPYGPCDSKGTPALGIVEVTTGSPDATLYVDDRNFLHGNGVWIYQESNGIWVSQGPGVHTGDVTDHNVQRWDRCLLDACPDIDGCVDDWTIEPDRLIF